MPTRTEPVHHSTRESTIRLYCLRRRSLAGGASEIDAASRRLDAFEAQPTLPARRLHSFVLREADGRFGPACLFAAESRAVLRAPGGATHLPAVDTHLAGQWRRICRDWRDWGRRWRRTSRPDVDARVNGRTRLTMRERMVSAEILCSMRAMGMEQGWNESLERLEAELQRKAG